MPGRGEVSVIGSVLIVLVGVAFVLWTLYDLRGR